MASRRGQAGGGREGAQSDAQVRIAAARIVDVCGARAGKIGEATGGEGGEMSKELTLVIYNQIGWVTIGVAVVVLAVSPLVKRWMHLDTLEDRAAPAGDAA